MSRGSVIALAHGRFEVEDYVSTGDLYAHDGKTLGIAGTLAFDLTGPPWPELCMVIEASAWVQIVTPGYRQDCVDFSAEGEAAAVARALHKSYKLQQKTK
jgi:hypothetical protein